MRINRNAVLPVIVIALLGIALGLTLLLPIYPDEIADRIFWERYFITGGFKQSVTPFCEDAFLIAPGLFLIPAAVFWSLLSKLGSFYLSYRVLPYLAFVATCGMVAVVNLRKGNKTFWPLLLLPTFGPALYGLILLRSEVFILCSGMALYLLGESMLTCKKTLPLFLKAFAAALIFCLCVYLHPKALYLLVALYGALLLSIRNLRTWPQRLIFGVLFFSLATGMSAEALSLHSRQFIECHSLPSIQKEIEGNMALQAVNPLDVLLNRSRFFSALHAAYDETAFDRIARGLSYGNAYDVDFLPPDHLDDSGRLANFIIKCAVLAFVLYIAIKTCACLIFLKGADQRKRFYLAGSVILSLALPFLLNITRYFYEESYLMGALMAMAGLLWPFRIGNFSLYEIYGRRTMAAIMISGSMLCLSISGMSFIPAFLHGFEGRGLSYKTDKEYIGAAVHHALDQLSVSEQEPLIVDDLTYDAVRRHRLVLPITYLGFVAAVPDAVRHYSFQYQTHYGVTRCAYLKWTFLDRVAYDVKVTIPNAGVSENKSSVKNNICVFELK